MFLISFVLDWISIKNYKYSSWIFSTSLIPFASEVVLEYKVLMGIRMNKEKQKNSCREKFLKKVENVNDKQEAKTKLISCEMEIKPRNK